MELALAILLGVLVAVYGLWFLIGLWRYVRSDLYKAEKYLTKVTE